MIGIPVGSRFADYARERGQRVLEGGALAPFELGFPSYCLTGAQITDKCIELIDAGTRFCRQRPSWQVQCGHRFIPLALPGFHLLGQLRLLRRGIRQFAFLLGYLSDESSPCGGSLPYDIDCNLGTSERRNQ